MCYDQKSEHEANTVIKYTESYKACIVRTVKKNKAITLRNVGLREESDA